jgi:hypothetical protein
MQAGQSVWQQPRNIVEIQQLKSLKNIATKRFEAAVFYIQVVT